MTRDGRENTNVKEVGLILYFGLATLGAIMLLAALCSVILEKLRRLWRKSWQFEIGDQAKLIRFPVIHDLATVHKVIWRTRLTGNYSGEFYLIEDSTREVRGVFGEDLQIHRRYGVTPHIPLVVEIDGSR